MHQLEVTRDLWQIYRQKYKIDVKSRPRFTMFEIIHIDFTNTWDKSDNHNITYKGPVWKENIQVYYCYHLIIQLRTAFFPGIAVGRKKINDDHYFREGKMYKT